MFRKFAMLYQLYPWWRVMIGMFVLAPFELAREIWVYYRENDIEARVADWVMTK